MRSAVGCRLTHQMTACDLDESILLDAACHGDARAFGALFDRHRPGLEEVCCLMLGDPLEAERAMREAVLTAWRERERAVGSSSVRMWLYRIAVDTCMEALGCPR
jgi:DNA-directed RNA polymerase specialized sigma24 family protein